MSDLTREALRNYMEEMEWPRTIPNERIRERETDQEETKRRKSPR